MCCSKIPNHQVYGVQSITQLLNSQQNQLLNCDAESIKFIKKLANHLTRIIPTFHFGLIASLLNLFDTIFSRFTILSAEVKFFALNKKTFKIEDIFNDQSLAKFLPFVFINEIDVGTLTQSLMSWEKIIAKDEILQRKFDSCCCTLFSFYEFSVIL